MVEEPALILTILTYAKYVCSFIFVFGVVVFIHELGHFLMAKFFGVYVEEFALGMGPKILGMKKGETEYKLCAFPIGGYVKMSGEEPEEADNKALSEKDYYGQAPYKRFLITFFGPFMNFVLAIILFTLVFMMGIYDYPPVIGPVEKGSSAEEAGILPGDTVLSANGKKIRSYSEITQAIDKSEDMISLKVLRGGSETVLNVPVKKEETENFFREVIEINTIGIDIHLEPVVEEVAPLTPASFSGLKAGDKIQGINAFPVKFWQDIPRILNEENLEATNESYQEWEKTWNALSTNKEVDKQTKIVNLTYMRDGNIMQKAVVLHAVKQKMIVKSGKESMPDEEYNWIIGIHIPDKRQIYKFNPAESFLKACDRTYATSAFIVKVFATLFQGRLGKKALGGPIMIGKMITMTADLGLMELLLLTAVLSINLGMLNYFPFPALDGGHMAFSLLEMIRKKPMKLKTMEYIQKAGFAVLITLIVYVSYQDILRLVTGE